VTTKPRGFTLVEVMVAMVVMAVLAGMAWQGIDAISRGQQGTRAAMERTLRVNTVVAQFEQDLGAVQETPAVNPLAFDGATLRLTRRTPQGMQLVAWSLQGQRFVRWAGPVTAVQAELQDSWMRSHQLDNLERPPTTALEGVTAWQVYFYRGNSWSNAQSSGDLVAAPAAVPAPTPTSTPSPTSAPAPASPASAPPRVQLPTGVRLVLNQGEQVLTRDIVIAAWPS
jgi:general secretion pathway protein J